MKVCILGNGLVSLTLAKALVNEGVYVDIISKKKYMDKNRIRTLGISKSNIEFLNKNILNVEKLLWNINRIEIFSENFQDKKVLDFNNNNQRLFSIIKNYEFHQLLLSSLKKDEHFKYKKKFNKKDYKLIINCELNNQITKKFFYRKFNKDYKSFAYTTIIEHEKKLNNYVASQIFTNKGPLAFLPVSEKSTSIVYSLKGNEKINLKDLIKKYNTKYKITRIKDIFNFELKSSNLRSYYYKNILAFGDLLHKLHPLAGQGFNMSLRDIKELLRLIRIKKDNGLDLDSLICSDFEKNTKHKNYLFSNGIDLIYEFFNFESKSNSNILSRALNFVNKNKNLNKFFTKIADKGI